MSITQPPQFYKTSGRSVIVCSRPSRRCAYIEGRGVMEGPFEVWREDPTTWCRKKPDFFCDHLMDEVYGATCGKGVCSDHGEEVGWGRHRCWEHMESL